jgi:hypothetical protein
MSLESVMAEIEVMVPGDVATETTVKVEQVSAQAGLRAERFVGLSGAETSRLIRGLALIALASGFVLIGGENLDLGPIESRLGIAAGEVFGPFGQMSGGWEPSLWPAEVAFSRLWSLGEGGTPTVGAVRWPAAIAGVLAGFLLTRRIHRALGARASVLMGLCWFGSVALIDRSAGAGLDLILGLATTAALDRILGHGSDTAAGLWAGLAFLAGGWPPLALIALVSIVIGRREARLSPGLIIPPLLTALAWSAWALSQAQAEAWAAALTLPLTEKSAWWFAAGVLALGLPWSPMVALVSSRSVRAGWTDPGRALILGWLQVAVACLVVGTLVPGLANAARIPALAGLAVVAAACIDRAWAGTVANAPRRAFLALAFAVVAVWVALVIVAGIFLASAVPYYRGVAIVLIALALAAGLIGLAALLRAEPRRGVLAMLAVAACLKIAHWGYYVPEWNYRRSQGPWGRAIGQWVVPDWPIYTVHTWEPDLAFATRHPFRQLRQPKNLAFQDGPEPKFVLLLGPEFEHWPADAPPLVKVATFQDERGSTRVLARTAGPFSLRDLIPSRRDEESRTR